MVEAVGSVVARWRADMLRAVLYRCLMETGWRSREAAEAVGDLTGCSARHVQDVDRVLRAEMEDDPELRVVYTAYLVICRQLGSQGRN